MAKVASRDRGSKVESDSERFTVVIKDTGRRIYVGPGTDQKDAERLAASMVHESKVVPMSEIVGGYHRPDPEAETE